MNKPHLLLVEVFFLYLIPLIFVGVYSWIYIHPVEVVYQHLFVVSMAIASALLLKALMHQHFPNEKLVWFLSALLYSAMLYALLIYYAVVIVGLNSWSRVTTKEFIATYIRQAQHFCDALGLSLPLIILTLVLVYLLFFAFTCYLVTKTKWTIKSNQISPTLFSFLLVSLLTLSLYQLNEYINNGSAFFKINPKEPIWQTMFSGRPKPQNHNANQGNTVDWHLHELENKVRNNYVSNPNPTYRNLVIIVVDGLRPRNMSLYGYERETTPHLDKLYAEKRMQIARNVRSTCGETSCGHASLLGSRYSHELPDNLFTLQEALMKHGYETNMIISGDHINFYNMRPLYGNVHHYYDGSMADGYYINDDMLTVDKTKSLPNWNGKPTLFHYHLLSAHVVGKLIDEFATYKPYANYAGMRVGPPNLLYTNYYDNGIKQSDFIIKELLSTLESKGYLENALVVITSDHGEALGEHNLLVHTNSVREEVLHIPLLTIPYGYESSILKGDNQFISILDIAPSILKEFNIPIPEVWSGKTVQNNERTTFTFFQMYHDIGLYDHTNPSILWKYWINKTSGEEFAFNLSNDPWEKENLIWKLPLSQKEKWRGEVTNIYVK